MDVKLGHIFTLWAASLTHVNKNLIPFKTRLSTLLSVQLIIHWGVLVKCLETAPCKCKIKHTDPQTSMTKYCLCRADKLFHKYQQPCKYLQAMKSKSPYNVSDSFQRDYTFVTLLLHCSNSQAVWHRVFTKVEPLISRFNISSWSWIIRCVLICQPTITSLCVAKP